MELIRGRERDCGQEYLVRLSGEERERLESLVRASKSSPGRMTDMIRHGPWPLKVASCPPTAGCQLISTFAVRYSAAAGGEMLETAGPDLTRVIVRAGCGLRSRSLSTCTLSATARCAEAGIKGKRIVYARSGLQSR